MPRLFAERRRPRPRARDLRGASGVLRALSLRGITWRTPPAEPPSWPSIHFF